jgi:hypothetical protein
MTTRSPATPEQALAAELRDTNRISPGQSGHPLTFISEQTKADFLAKYPEPVPVVEKPETHAAPPARHVEPEPVHKHR